MIQFAHPAYFYLLILLVPLALWYYFRHDRHDAAMKVASTAGYGRQPQTWRTRLMPLPFCLRLLAMALVIVALARPQTNKPSSEREVEGIDIMLAMDVSVSMETPDLKPNRIEAAKEVALEFISGRPYDNIGMTLFGGEAFTQCPMTTDHHTLVSMFKNVNCELQEQGVLADGTAIGMGLMNAVSRLADSRCPSKVVILITDGANNSGDISPITAAEIAKSKHVRVYTIAVGTQGMVKVPTAILPDGTVYYTTQQSDMDPETLEQIAKMTGGKFYMADNKEKLRQIYSDIDKLERVKMKVNNYSKRYEAFLPFGLGALLALLLEVLLRLTIFRRLP